jgi:hypothetical protein
MAYLEMDTSHSNPFPQIFISDMRIPGAVSAVSFVITVAIHEGRNRVAMAGTALQ